MNKYILVLLSLSLISSCSNNVFENFDNDGWKNDRNGCSGKRATLVNTVLNRKAELFGLNEIEIIKSFGKPDMNDLRRRQQKFYYYYINNSAACKNEAEDKILKIRFNAIDHVQEVLYE